MASEPMSDARLAKLERWGTELRSVDSAYVRELVAEIERLREEAEEPPTWGEIMAGLEVVYPTDIFPVQDEPRPRSDPGPRILSLIRHLDDARARVDRVRELHQPVAIQAMGWGDDEPQQERTVQVCRSCGTRSEYPVEHPCPTIRALDGGGADE